MNRRERVARRLRAFTAIAILASAACVDDAASDRAAAEQEITSGSDAVAMRLPVEIVPLEAVHPTEAALFAALLAEETARGGGLPLTLGGALGAGQAGEGTYVIAVIDIGDKDGKPLHRLLNEATLAEARSDAMSEPELRRFAASTAERISQWYAVWSPPGALTLASANPDAALVTGSLATPRFRISVGQAPGDGASALTRALESELAAQGPNVPWRGARDISIEGNIITSSRPDGRTDIAIHWVLTSADGATLGELHQKNALDAARISGAWGEVAESAAKAAAKGVIAILETGPARVASRG